MVSPYKITVYDRAFTRHGFVGNPTLLTVTPRHNAQGTASLTVGADHRMVKALTDPGARVLIEHMPVTGGEWEFLMSGWVTAADGAGPAVKATVTVQIADDAGALLSAVRGWPVPGSAITNQTAAEYDTRTGAAETVLKGFVTANAVNRLGLPLTVATDLGRGATIPGGVAIRFQTLTEKLLPAIDAAGIGVTVRQQGAGLVLDVYEPRTYPHTLSERAATITEWSWRTEAPGATRAVAGGKGEGTARAFAQSIDTGLESDWGRVIEGYRDATDANTTADLTARAQQELADNAPRAGFSVKLSQSQTFRYGGPNGVRVGDKVTVDIGGQLKTDVLRECTLAYSRDNGPTQTPVIGDIDQTTDRALIRIVRGIRDSVNRIRR
jgi:hypothetical protein